MWYLIVSIPDLCILTYFKNAKINVLKKIRGFGAVFLIEEQVVKILSSQIEATTNLFEILLVTDFFLRILMLKYLIFQDFLKSSVAHVEIISLNNILFVTRHV